MGKPPVNLMDGFVPDLAAWDAWTPAEIARRLAGVQAPWYVAAGWAARHPGVCYSGGHAPKLATKRAWSGMPVW
jgi:hypothetical protein